VLAPSRAVACRIACFAALAALAASLSVAVAVAGARPSTRAERVAAADAFASRTLTFDREQRAAGADALRALAARRASAQDCLVAWQAAPPARRGDLGLVYFEYLSGALWSVDAPLFRHWITDLRRSKRIDRSPVLARAADALRRAYLVASRIYTAVPDACATVIAWRDAGWTDAARPAVLAAIDGLASGGSEAGDEDLVAAGGRQLERYARHGKAAAAVLRIGVDEPDARVATRAGCDAVGALVLPGDYMACAP
jgi:hypothetical protein